MGQLDFPLPYWDNVSDSAKVSVAEYRLKCACLGEIITNIFLNVGAYYLHAAGGG